MLQKISNLENKIEELKKQRVATVVTNTPVQRVENKVVEAKKTTEIVESADKFKEEEKLKKLIVENGNLKIYSAIAGARTFISENILIVVTNNSFAYSILKQNETIDVIKSIYDQNFGVIDNVYIRLQEDTIEVTPKIEKYLNENDINYTKLD